MESPNISLQVHEGSVVVKVCGQARVDCAEQLRQLLQEAEITKELLVDWQDAEHVDASVFQVLISARQMLKARSVPLMVANDNTGVRDYLRVSGLSEYFPLQSSPTTAVNANG